ncbi:hypothetical protein KIN20_035782 [Parelaphostrongylus tenuis]|uniref:Methyltransferase FkbM domain-containing protein n=1 Tax=Parelaphostrongylus tenuis TaxID=148309 RepID=A0AAD5WJZ8_PARTN|nr:hypothetical protein KIN20_035782 [Parelaphostrongylus tenuis]
MNWTTRILPYSEVSEAANDTLAVGRTVIDDESVLVDSRRLLQISRGDSSNLFVRNHMCLRSRTDGMGVEEIWGKLPLIINQCTMRRFLRLTGYRNDDEVKVHVIPSQNAFTVANSCSIVSLGIGGDVKAERKMKNDMPKCKFFGADPVKYPNQELFEKIGLFYNIAVGGRNGTLEATVLEQGDYHVREVKSVDIATFLRNFTRKSLIDQLMIDIEWAEYEILPYFLRSGDLEKSDIVICQVNIELHSPNPTQKRQFFEFFHGLMNDYRFTPLAVNSMIHHIRSLGNTAQSTSSIVGPPAEPPPGIPPPGMPPGIPPGAPPALWYILVMMGLQTDSNSFC